MFVIPLIKCGETEGEGDTSEPQPGELRKLFAHEIDLPLEGATVPIIPYLSKQTLKQWLHPLHRTPQIKYLLQMLLYFVLKRSGHERSGASANVAC